MGKAQGSLEYLLILAAILAIAVVVIVVANSMLGAPSATADANKDKYAAITVGVELVGYDTLYTGTTATMPKALVYKSNRYLVQQATNQPANPVKIAEIGAGAGGTKFPIYVDASLPTPFIAYLITPPSPGTIEYDVWAASQKGVTLIGYTAVYDGTIAKISGVSMVYNGETYTYGGTACPGGTWPSTTLKMGHIDAAGYTTSAGAAGFVPLFEFGQGFKVGYFPYPAPSTKKQIIVQGTC